MSVVLIILGLLLALAGLVGCLLPILPGPPLTYGGLLLLAWAKDWEPFSALFLIIMAAITAAAVALDYILPALGAKKHGSSKWGIGGSVVGMLVGAFFFPPFGMIIGAFVGAVLGELAAGKQRHEALKAGWGVFVGTMAATVVKLAVCGVMLFYFFANMF